MVKPVHGRRNKKNPEKFFKLYGNLEGTVMKLGCHNDQRLKKKKPVYIDTEE